jgi:hypothetical protein
MRITSFYCLSYPDRAPDDPYDAASEVYVEVGGDDATIDHFDHTYGFFVCTVAYIRKRIDSRGHFVTSRPMIVLERLDRPALSAALERSLPRIEEYGERKD